jgi:hypothetical protein
MAKLMAFFGSQTAKDTLATNRDYARPRAAHGTIVHTQVNLDGRTIAKVVSHHFDKEDSRPQTGISSFDPRMSQMPAGGLP